MASWLGGVAVVALALALIWFTQPSPRERFEKDIRSVVDAVNQGDVMVALPWISPEWEKYLASHGISSKRQFLLAVRQIDSRQAPAYRINRIISFAPDFAEVEFVRVAGGDSATFALPFAFREDRWWVITDFRTNGLVLPHPPDLGM